MVDDMMRKGEATSPYYVNPPPNESEDPNLFCFGYLNESGIIVTSVLNSGSSIHHGLKKTNKQIRAETNRAHSK